MATVGNPPELSSVPLATSSRSPSLAFLFSLIMPGFGQFYCRKVKRGVWTLAFFALSHLGIFFLYPFLEGDDHRLVALWGASLRAGIFLYIFAFLDAFFTAREINAGRDKQIEKNPRIAAILNLLTRGFGYFYLGEKKKEGHLFCPDWRGRSRCHEADR